MTKDDKIDLIDRINAVNDRFESVNGKIETVNRKFDAFDNRLFNKMESNFRWLITLALTAIFGGVTVAATIFKMLV